MSVEMIDSRRLTGPNLLLDRGGAIIDATCPNKHREIIASLWKETLNGLLKNLKWENEQIAYRLFDSGINLAFTAPFDSLYTATEVNELSFNIACRKFQGEKDITSDIELNKISQHLIEEINPPLIKLIEKAITKQTPFLTDDENFSLGFGCYSSTWPVRKLPKDDDELKWHQFKEIPVFLVTGSNGKSTTVRLLSSILNCARYKTGLTSTDFIRVGNTIIDHGDYSGPGGARTILRHKLADAAVLEIARGGILRRGLPCTHATGAAVTNIAEDHLGDYGITKIDEMAETKFVVHKGLKKDGLLIINADDDVLMKVLSNSKINRSICYTSLEKTDFEHQVFLDGSCIYHKLNNETEIICEVSDIPITLNGAAKHNISNAMTAIALAKSNHINTLDIKKGLALFKGDLTDNPGRGNYFTINNATVLVDFAHNAHGMQAIVDTVKNIKSSRRLLMIGQAGDRSDQDIIELAKQAAGIKPDFIVITEILNYLRGREIGEIPNIFKQEFLSRGFTEEQICIETDPLNGVQTAMKWSKPNDMLVLFALSQRDEIFHFLRDQQNEI